MRSGSVSQRDIEGRREYREFAQAEAERQRLSEDQESYQRYVANLEDENRRTPPAFHVAPVSFNEFLRAMPQDVSDPELRGQMALQRCLGRRTAASEREQVLNGHDPQLYLAPELVGAHMGEDKARKFNAEQAKRFRENTPEYFPSNENLNVLVDYFDRNAIPIINEAMFRAAWERLRSFGAIQERPEPEPEPVPELRSEPQPESVVDDGTMVGIDPLTGLERRYTAREIGRMSSYEFKRAFDLNLENRIAAWEEMFVRPSRY
ncbi:MAG: hypothetical protein ACJ71Q_09050 [Terriglobales bacterium]